MTTNSTDPEDYYQQKFGSSTGTHVSPYPQPQQASCPNCGYCPHCGRSNGWGTYPQYPYPWPTITWCKTNS